jgi:hypothetical protein
VLFFIEERPGESAGAGHKWVEVINWNVAAGLIIIFNRPKWFGDPRNPSLKPKGGSFIRCDCIHTGCSAKIRLHGTSRSWLPVLSIKSAVLPVVGSAGIGPVVVFRTVECITVGVVWEWAIKWLKPGEQAASFMDVNNPWNIVHLSLSDG